LIPAPFDYLRAHTTDEAFAHLQHYGAEARVLAGGQSLIPAMRFRLARPAVLVDINAITDLAALRMNGALLVGAIARDSDIERAPWINDSRWSLIRDVSRVVADPVVRQLGTVVGSLCHNDPAGDWTAASLAARAEVAVRGKDGVRSVPIDDFLVSSYTTAVGEGELALGVHFPAADDRTAGAYQKVERKVGDFATAGAAAFLVVKGGVIERAGIGLTNVGPMPIKATEAEKFLAGKKPDEATFAEAGRLAAAATKPGADRRGSVEYKKDMARVLTVRALRKAAQRAGGK
jgi:carbon-monoxide dehydrogenase medium subunit